MRTYDMAGARFGTTYRDIEHLFAEGTLAGCSDTQLLSRFSARRDESAFAALLARHGPMVMSVCRGVLRDAADAEDAFQATFLTLARKSGSHWTEGQLGGWLHRVAYRVAVRAAADSSRRSRHEQRAAESAEKATLPADAEDELRQTLHDELARLPAKLRLPIVLCFLEGLTHAEAAGALRCGEATVRRRLTGARERLKRRLTLRGFAPASIAAALAVGSGKTEGAVPPALTEATVRAALGLAAGGSMAGVVSSRVAGLCQTPIHGFVSTARALTIAAVSLAAAVGIAARVGARDAGAPPPKPSEPSSRPDRDATRPALARVDPPPRSKETGRRATPGTRRHSVEGIVLGPDGRPMARAKVYWTGFRRFERKQMAQPRGTGPEPSRVASLAVGETDAAGRFALAAEFDGVGFPGRMLTVMSGGAGVLGRTFLNETVDEGGSDLERRTFRLSPSATIEGRLLTPAGTPAVGVKVTLEEVFDSEDELAGSHVSSGSGEGDPNSAPNLWPTSWTTDASGRFRIEGVVPEKNYARIKLHHPDLADDGLIVSTGLPLSDWLRAFDVSLLDAKFTHVMEPARPVTGVVTDRATGKPLAGVLVEVIAMKFKNRYGGNESINVRTDDAGRYRVSGPSGDLYQVAVYPDPSSGYYPIQRQSDSWPVGARVMNVDFALSRPKGSVLRGRVVESGTGRGIEGASVVYEPGGRNPSNRGEYDFRNSVLTDAQGNFALTVLPGAGLLGVEGPSADYIRSPIEGEPSDRSSISRPHGYARLDLPDAVEGDRPPVTIELRKGVCLEAWLVDAEGNPVDMTMGWCAEIMASQLDNWVSPEPIPGGLFRLEGAEPERTYRAYFLHPKRKLGAVVDLKDDPKGPVNVRLEPTATVKATILDERGRPLKGAQILPWLDLTDGSHPLTDLDTGHEGKATPHTSFTMDPLLPEYSAEFSCDTLIPGARYYIGARGTYHRIPDLKPGQVLDLGKVVMKPRKGD